MRHTLAVIARLHLFRLTRHGPHAHGLRGGHPQRLGLRAVGLGALLHGGSLDGHPERHVVVRRELWCAPCNLIRRPPAECDTKEPPECLRIVGVDEVYACANKLLREGTLA